MNYKEFYIWLDGYFSAKSKEEKDGNVYFMDIFPVLEKMKEVKDDFDVDKFKHLTEKRFRGLPVTINVDKDDLGHPPKIVM